MEKATYCKKISKKDSIINFKESAEKIFANLEHIMNGLEYVFCIRIKL